MRANGNKAKISIKDAKVDQMVGVLFSGLKENESREDLIEKLFTMKIQVGCCRKEYTYTFMSFPREDLKCDCGKKGRWVVKYE